MSSCSDKAIADGVDPSTPIDRETLKTDARNFMGHVGVDVLPEEDLDSIVQTCINKFEDSIIYKCEVLYCVVLNSLRDIIRRGWAESGNIAGDLVGYKEKEGNIEVSANYSTSAGGSSKGTGWERLYEEFLQNPDYICSCLAKDRGGFGYIKIGGTKREEYLNNEYNTAAHSMWDIGSSSDKFNERRVLRERRSRNRSKRIRY
ncbi:hypothetical protein NVP1084O_127 [Vibrio phage 1.084.O._10N.261.49.F5]|nr:hypothetical protein NVP1084O_127 [Vibrio phage 1.084.O._10N.261.49.F5]